MTGDDARRFELDAYWATSGELLGLIRGQRFDSRTATERRTRAIARLARVRALLARLGNPQRRFPVVHVTGTSGKGSTSAVIAAILTASGYRVGLRTSPYLQVATEKLQIGPALIDAASFARIAREILFESATIVHSDQPEQQWDYAEIWTALAFQWFAERDVDIAVVEVGAGGRFDTTNVIDPLVSVITSVGMDHVVSLGPTIADIAWHKAGIIKPGSIAVVGNVSAEAFAVIDAEARAVGAPIVRATDAAHSIREGTGMRGQFQQANARVAIGAVAALHQQGICISESAIPAGLESARLPGRLEKMPGCNAAEIWLDGAHNADKIAALAREAALLSSSGELPVVVLGVLGTKDAQAIARGLHPVSSSIVVTRPMVTGKRSLPADALARAVRESGFTGEIVVEPIPESAVACAESIARAKGSCVLVTGSMYLAGQVRRRWHLDDEIVWQRTPWPVRSPPNRE